MSKWRIAKNGTIRANSHPDRLLTFWKILILLTFLLPFFIKFPSFFLSFFFFDWFGCWRLFLWFHLATIRDQAPVCLLKAVRRCVNELFSQLSYLRNMAVAFVFFLSLELLLFVFFFTAEVVQKRLTLARIVISRYRVLKRYKKKKNYPKFVFFFQKGKKKVLLVCLERRANCRNGPFFLSIHPHTHKLTCLICEKKKEVK